MSCYYIKLNFDKNYKKIIKIFNLFIISVFFHFLDLIFLNLLIFYDINAIKKLNSDDLFLLGLIRRNLFCRFSRFRNQDKLKLIALIDINPFNYFFLSIKLSIL